MNSATPEREPAFTPSDVWVLHAIAFACRHGEAASLKDVIAMGDAVQRIIFSGAELRRAMSKLTHAGYVSETEGAFQITGEARDLWVTHSGQGKSTRWWHDTFERLLNPDPDHAPSNHSDDDPAWAYDKITDQDVAAAAKDYSREFWAAYEALRNKN